MEQMETCTLIVNCIFSRSNVCIPEVLSPEQTIVYLYMFRTCINIRLFAPETGTNSGEVDNKSTK